MIVRQNSVKITHTGAHYMIIVGLKVILIESSM